MASPEAARRQNRRMGKEYTEELRAELYGLLHHATRALNHFARLNPQAMSHEDVHSLIKAMYQAKTLADDSTNRTEE